MRRVALGAGMAVGAGLGLALRHALSRQLRYGPWGSLGAGLPGGVDAVGLALVQATSTEMLEGNRLCWRDDGEVFSAIEAAFRAARHSIHVDVYIWKPGQPGERLARLAAQRAREGVAVRIMVDPLGSPGFKEQLYPLLREAGCEVHAFRPFWRYPLGFTGRNHRKLVIVDGRVGFTGGFGFSPEWEGDGISVGAWRDANVEVEGPVVRQMQVAFANHWLEVGGHLLPAEELERARPAGSARAAYVTSTDVKGLSHARWVTHIALAAAQRRVWVANAYFIPPPAVLGTLCERPARGVEVRLLLPGPHLDHFGVRTLQHLFYPRLQRSGVRVYEYQPSMMHAKTMLVDDRVVVVGSINLDYYSLEFMEEGSLVVDDVPFAAQCEQRWERDLARSREMFAQSPERTPGHRPRRHRPAGALPRRSARADPLGADVPDRR